ncbi:MAG: septal ring lytic transglycosylase RlpA family protein [Gammaproteobacteria bacterium]
MRRNRFSVREIFEAIARCKKQEWTVLMTSAAAMIRRLWPFGFVRAAKTGTVVLVMLTLAGSSKQMSKQEFKGNIPVYLEFGEASWYGPGFQGRETASGDIFDTHKMTAAHPTLPLGTKVEVINPQKGKKVEVKITDRGPYAKGRAIDLSKAAAKKLGIVKKGTADVKIVIKAPKEKSARKKSAKKNEAKK